MQRKLFINLAAADVKAATDFYQQLGFGFNPQFSDNSASCIVLADHLYLMLLTKEKFAGFSPHPLVNGHQQTQVLNCLSCHSKAEVDELVQKAVKAGGNTYNQPQDHGVMYAHGFQDLDGHVWELVYMEMLQASV
ncbi:VOC family protein [Rheinheimera mangrovi]|jgi:predicted lactoylglutathione lyase|uniref:VOC family protein n=1 Tax=Rheinheimera mangrovi TaxID=2498451 RepID=UPI000F8F7D05|nr:VOC family protein [Rheinheimera mangrovi]